MLIPVSQGAYPFDFVLRLQTCVDFINAQHTGNGLGRVGMVAGEHGHPHAQTVQVRQHLLGFRPRLVPQSDQADGSCPLGNIQGVVSHAYDNHGFTFGLQGPNALRRFRR